MVVEEGGPAAVTDSKVREIRPSEDMLKRGLSLRIGARYKVIVELGNHVEFVLHSGDTGHLLPFHPFTVYDEGGAEVASGKTDENAEASIQFAKKGEFYIVAGSKDLFSVEGTVFYRDGKTPIADASLEAHFGDGESTSIRTGSKGEIELSDVPNGELRLDYEDSEYSILVDRDISGGSIFMPYERGGGAAESTSLQLTLTLRDETDAEVLPFQKFTVFDENDTEIATGKSDDRGEATVTVPEPGNYRVVVETEKFATAPADGDDVVRINPDNY